MNFILAGLKADNTEVRSLSSDCIPYDCEQQKMSMELRFVCVTRRTVFFPLSTPNSLQELPIVLSIMLVQDGQTQMLRDIVDMPYKDGHLARKGKHQFHGKKQSDDHNVTEIHCLSSSYDLDALGKWRYRNRESNSSNQVFL